MFIDCWLLQDWVSQRSGSQGRGSCGLREMEQAVLPIPARSFERTQDFRKHIGGNFLYNIIRRVDDRTLQTPHMKQYKCQRKKPHCEKVHMRRVRSLLA